MTQAEQLPKNIDKLIEKIYELKEKTFFAPPVPKIDIDSMILTKRQIAKRMILLSGGIISSAGTTIVSLDNSKNTILTSFNMMGADVPNPSSVLDDYETQFALNASQVIGKAITPESAHFIIYGKFKRDSNGNLIDNEILDPDCVLKELAMPETHPTMTEIGVMIKKTIKALRMLGIKQQELLDDIAQTMIAIPSSVTAIASAAVILPFGAGIPVAFSAFMGLMSNIMNLVSKISGLAIDIENLTYLPIIIGDKADSIIGIINTQLIAIITILSTIDGLTKIIPRVPIPPGVANQPGEPIEIEASVSPEIIQYGQSTNVYLSVRASKGSWEYDYKWRGTDGFYAEGKNVTIVGGPLTTTIYEVTVTDKKNKSNISKAEVRVEVTYNQ